MRVYHASKAKPANFIKLKTGLKKTDIQKWTLFAKNASVFYGGIAIKGRLPLNRAGNPINLQEKIGQNFRNLFISQALTYISEILLKLVSYILDFGKLL